LGRKSRTDQRTRERLPVLPALISWVQAQTADPLIIDLDATLVTSHSDKENVAGT
jgi:hypothetical protein